MSSLEQFRRISEYQWDITGDLVDATIQLLWDLQSQEQMLFVALRRLLQHQIGIGELWSIGAIVLNAPTPIEGVTKAYLWWSDHRERCLYHDVPLGKDTNNPATLLVSAWSDSSCLVFGGSQRSLVRDEFEFVSCGARYVQETVMTLLTSDLEAMRARHLEVVALKGRSVKSEVVGESGELEPFRRVPASLLAPFPPRLGQ